MVLNENLMKNSIITAVALCCSLTISAQGQRPSQPKMPNFIFTTVDSIAITPIKNQSNAGTCWAYSGIGFIESEILRTKKKAYDLSEMFVAFNTYMDRAEKAVRTSGDVSFGQGGDFGDILVTMEQYGMVPDSEMPAGAMYGKELSNHSELSALTNPMVDAIARGRLRSGMQVSPDGEQLYKKALRAVHEVYLGKCPEKFIFEGKEYTPLSFAKTLGINSKDYVSLTSFTHHPYSEGKNIGIGYALEAQDNWRWQLSYNLELDDFCQIFEDALKAGYTILWGTDVSEQGFTRQGVGVYNDEKSAESSVGSDQAHWVGIDPSQGTNPDEREILPKPQKVVTPAERQAMYDGKTTTDDHAMQIFGIAKDQWGNKYYMVKNSWGNSGNYHGIYYVTPEYVRAKTLNILINKNAISKALKTKYGIK